MIRFFNFALNKQLVAQEIFQGFVHQTTKQGVIINNLITKELTNLLKEFNQFVKAPHTPYYRIDAYFDSKNLYILEINAAFVDGWGTALNLSRASGIPTANELLRFPIQFHSAEANYLPELELFIAELKYCGIDTSLGMNWGEPTYIYGRNGHLYNSSTVFPQEGNRIDNKSNLAKFSQIWRGNSVHIPKHYYSPSYTWEALPEEIVLKFCDKDSTECKKAGRSVYFGKSHKKSSYLLRCFTEGSLIGQELITPKNRILDDCDTPFNCQLIILAIGSDPLTGYTQYSPNKIINDNSIHGPLWIQ